MEVFKIGDNKVTLEDFELGKGQITINNNYGGNYSYFWGAMGSTLRDFIQSINSSYFSSKMCVNMFEFSAKKTKQNVRKLISEELSWYEHMEFQKDMREKINEHFDGCESSNDFVWAWSRFVDSLDFYLIEDRWKRDNIKSYFEGVSEVWHLIGENYSQEYELLCKLHKDLVKAIKKNKGIKYSLVEENVG